MNLYLERAQMETATAGLSQPSGIASGGREVVGGGNFRAPHPSVTSAARFRQIGRHPSVIRTL